MINIDLLFETIKFVIITTYKSKIK